MEINLSDKSIEVIINSLRNSRSDLKRQINKWEQDNEPNKKEICEVQLAEVEEVLDIFDEASY